MVIRPSQGTIGEVSLGGLRTITDIPTTVPEVSYRLRRRNRPLDIEVRFSGLENVIIGSLRVFSHQLEVTPDIWTLGMITTISSPPSRGSLHHSVVFSCRCRNGSGVVRTVVKDEIPQTSLGVSR